MLDGLLKSGWSSESRKRVALIGKDVLLPWTWICQHSLLLDALALRAGEHTGVGAGVLGQIIATGWVELVNWLVIGRTHCLFLAGDGLQPRHLGNLHVCCVFVAGAHVIVVLAELLVVVCARTRILNHLLGTLMILSREWSGRRDRKDGALRSLMSLAS